MRVQESDTFASPQDGRPRLQLPACSAEASVVPAEQLSSVSAPSAPSRFLHSFKVMVPRALLVRPPACKSLLSLFPREAELRQGMIFSLYPFETCSKRSNLLSPRVSSILSDSHTQPHPLLHTSLLQGLPVSLITLKVRPDLLGMVFQVLFYLTPWIFPDSFYPTPRPPTLSTRLTE